MNKLRLALILLLAACSGSDLNTTYCNMPARLTIENVQQAPVLFTACESMDQFCTVTSDGQRFLFTNAAGKTDPINIMAINSYYLGVNGFIVGKPSIPEMGKDVPQVVCFDRVCPNCYTDSNYAITKDVTFSSIGYAKCKGCDRTYNLMDRGIVSNGQPGRALYRYRVSYIGNALVINNR